MAQAVMSKKIWLSSPHMGGEEINFIKKAFSENWIAPIGPNINGFESDIENYLGYEDTHVTALTSGTAAIHLGLKLLGVTQGDIVICQSFTFAASANPVKYLNATPVFVDSETETWNICPIQLELAINDLIAQNKKPKAIIAVHLYGMPYKVNEIESISKKYSIPVLEDSAEAMGSTYGDKKCGTFGHIGVISFNGNKIITTSGGGALISKSKQIKEQAIFLATQAKDNSPHYEHSEIGYNYRMSNISAGIGRGQMIALNKHILIRRENYSYYKTKLEAIKDIVFLSESVNSFSNRWLTCILTASLAQREKIRLALKESNIESRPLWKPMHLQPVFKNELCYVNGVSANLFNRGLCLPSGSNLELKDLQLVVKIIKKVML